MKLPTAEELGSIRYHQQRLHGTGLAPSAASFGSPPTTPKKVPPTPNNTPVSTPATSATNSPATLIGDSTKKGKNAKKPKKKMAKQNGPRPEKRHLVRWTDPMDKKLVLAMQYCCNAKGLAVPWTDIGNVMGDGISGGAVIQHLAKLRIRMVEQNLPVPPPLRRGGGVGRISTSASSGTKAKATPAKNSKANMAAPKKAKKGAKKADTVSDDSEEDGDGWINDDSDAEYGERAAKRRAKSSNKGAIRPRKMKAEDTDEEIITPSRPSKRKRGSTKSSPAQSHDDVEIKTEFTAAGANWLRLEDDDDDDDSHPKTGRKTVNKKPSLVVSLPGMVGGFEENPGDMGNDESEDEFVGGGVETFDDGPFDLGDEEVNEALPIPYNQNFQSQMDQTLSTTNRLATYNNGYNTNQLSMPFNGDQYTNSTGNQTHDGMFESNGLAQDYTVAKTEAFGSNHGGNSGMGQTNLHDQSVNDFPQYDGDFSGVWNNGLSQARAFGNGGMSGSNVQANASTYQVGNGYTASSNAYGTTFDHPLRFNEHNNAHAVPYPIQTSWPGNHNSAGPSNKTSVNQTPADTSAGVDLGAGYFEDSGHFAFNNFDNAVVDYSTNDGTDLLFGAGEYDGNLVGGGFFSNNTYGD